MVNISQKYQQYQIKIDIFCMFDYNEMELLTYTLKERDE